MRLPEKLELCGDKLKQTDFSDCPIGFKPLIIDQTVINQQKQIADQQALIEKLETLITDVPTGEYGEALTNGCDSNGAWDCFCDALIKWKEDALAAVSEWRKKVK